MNKNIRAESLQPFPEKLTAEQLTQSVKKRFVGEPTQASPRRTEMQNLGALSAAGIPLQELLPLGEPQVNSQLAVVFFPQIEELGQQFDAQVQKDNLTPAEVAQIVSAVSTEQHFRIPERLLPLASLIFAMLLLLTTVATACAADNPAASQVDQFPPQPALFIDTTATQPPVLGGGEGEPPTPVEAATQQICVFDSARNLRTGPSATAAKTTLDGSGTTVAGKEYQCFEKVENSDKSVWVRISEEPAVWAVLVLPGSGLTGTLKTKEAATTDAPWTSIETGVKITDTLTNTSILTETQITDLLADYNRIATSVGISQSVSITLGQEGKVLYVGADGKPVAIAEPIIDPMKGTLTAAVLFATDAKGNKIGDVPVALKSGDTGWQRNQSAVGTAPDIATTDTIGLPSDEGAPVVGQVEQGVALTTEEYMRSLFPTNFEEFFDQQGKSVEFDEKMGVFISVDGKTGEKRAIFPHASAGDPEKDLLFAESVFDAKQSCLSDAEVSSFNPQGVQRAVCMFTNEQHPIYGPLSFHPDLLKKQDEVLAYIAKYIYRGDQEKIDTSSFKLLINTSAADARDYLPRTFEDIDRDDEVTTAYEEWGLTGLGLPADPIIRLDVIPGQNGQSDTVIFNAFPNYADILKSVPEERLSLLPYTLPAKLLYLALKLQSDRIAGMTIPNDPGLDVLGTEIKSCKADKNATLGAPPKPYYLANLGKY